MREQSSICKSVPKKPKEKLRRDEARRRVDQDSREVESRVLEELHLSVGKQSIFAAEVLNSREFCCLCRSEYFNAHQVDLLRPTQSKVEHNTLQLLHSTFFPSRRCILNINTTTEAPKPAIDSNRTVFVGINQRNKHGPISS